MEDMMEILALVPFAVALLINAGTPGPSIAALVSRVITNGWRDVAPFVAAMWIGEVIWLTVAMAGLTALAETFALGFALLKWLGIGYLCWLAWKMWTKPVGERTDDLPSRRSPLSMFAAGMALTLSNPKIMVFYLALLPSLIDLSRFDLGSWAVVAVVTMLVLMFVDSIWIAMANVARTLLRTPRAMRIANRVGGTAMVGAAITIASRE